MSARETSALPFLLTVAVVFLTALLFGGIFGVLVRLAALLLLLGIATLFFLDPLLTGFCLLAALLLLLRVAALFLLHLALTGFGLLLTALHFRRFAALLFGAGFGIGLAALLFVSRTLLLHRFALAGLLLSSGFGLGLTTLLFLSGANGGLLINFAAGDFVPRRFGADGSVGCAALLFERGPGGCLFVLRLLLLTALFFNLSTERGLFLQFTDRCGIGA